MKLTPKQIAKIQLKDAEMPNSLKRNADVNYFEGWFFVTLNTRDEVPILSTCVGSPDIYDGQPGAPMCVYSELGKKVKEVWKRNEEIYPNVVVDMSEVMPEHFHGLIHLLPGNKKHLGQIIKGFLIGCSHAYWDILGIPWREMGYIKGVRTPQYEDKDHTMSYRGPALFVHGYNDTEPITEDDVETKRAYIRDQARKRLIQGDRHDCFHIFRGRHSHNWSLDVVINAIVQDKSLSYSEQKAKEAQTAVMTRLAAGASIDFVGNRDIMATKWKLPLICHRADAVLFDYQQQVVIDAARKGAVIVSAFISPRERDIKKELMNELLPFIEIMDNGFSERYKPGGKTFYAVAEKRLVQISPWNYLYKKGGVKVSREMCMVMNEMARIISGSADDWWKEKSDIDK